MTKSHGRTVIQSKPADAAQPAPVPEMSEIDRLDLLLQQMGIHLGVDENPKRFSFSGMNISIDTNPYPGLEDATGLAIWVVSLQSVNLEYLRTKFQVAAWPEEKHAEQHRQRFEAARADLVQKAEYELANPPQFVLRGISDGEDEFDQRLNATLRENKEMYVMFADVTYTKSSQTWRAVTFVRRDFLAQG